MTRRSARLLTLSLACLCTASAYAHQEGWKSPYIAGLKAANDGKWQDSRDNFKRAIADRPEDDMAGGLRAFGSDPKKAPYSANFAGAYAAYRLGLESSPDSARKLFVAAQQELEVLVGKQRAGREVFFTLARIYQLLGRTNDSQAFDTQWKSGILTWMDDYSVMTSDDKTALGIVDQPVVKPIQPVVTNPVKPSDTTQPTIGVKPGGTPPPQPGTTQGTQTGGGTAPPTPGTVQTGPPIVSPNNTAPTVTEPGTKPFKPKPLDEPSTNTAKQPPVVVKTVDKPRPLDDQGTPRVDTRKGQKPGLNNDNGPVAVVGTKYALIVGNSRSGMSDLAVPFGNDSASIVNDAVTKYAGYDPANIVHLSDATAGQIMDAAKSLAARVPEGGTVLIYFSGVGVNVDGKDYLAGADAGSAIDTSLMAAKSDMFHLFITKGARIFAFFETNRPRNNDAVFGQEEAVIGSIAQTFATIQGQRVLSSTYGGKDIGLFTQGVANVLKQFHSNAVPIQDFAWEVFYSMRRGGQEGTGGGSLQTPTLPIITYMPTEARF